MVLTVQYLRGFAAWLVFFHHYMQVFHDFQHETLLGRLVSNFGGLGVEVFFVISGFVMQYTVATQSYGATEFALNRVIRIVPAYWVATIVFLLVVSVLPLTGPLPAGAWDVNTLILSLFFIPHEHLGGFGEFPVLTVGWTLNFEMFFYALLSICILLFRGHALTVCLVLVVALPVLGTALGLDLGIASDPLLLLFAAGMAISAYGTAWLERISNLRLRIVLGLALILAAALYVYKVQPYHDLVGPVVMVVGFIALEPAAQAIGRAPLRVLEKIGEYSYSTYLMHVPALFLVLNLLGVPETQAGDLFALGLSLVVTVVLSILSFLYIEAGSRRILLQWQRFVLQALPARLK